MSDFDPIADELYERAEGILSSDSKKAMPEEELRTEVKQHARKLAFLWFLFFFSSFPHFLFLSILANLLFYTHIPFSFFLYFQLTFHIHFSIR